MKSKPAERTPTNPGALPDQALAQLNDVLSRCPATFAEHVRGVFGMEHLEWTVVDQLNESTPAWRPAKQALLITGDLHIDGNVLVKTTQRRDDTYLVVLGAVRCRNLIVGDGAAFLCAGALTAQEAIVCTSMGSVTEIAGDVQAQLLDSGQGAWMDVFDKAQIAAVQHLSSYVMVAGSPHSPEEDADLTELLIEDVQDTEEWDELDPEEQAEEEAADYVSLDQKKAFKLLAKGQSILA